MNRKVGYCSIVILLLFGLTACSDGPSAVIYPAAKVITMNPGQPVAQAVAVSDGTIVGVGTLQQLETLLAGQPYQVDQRWAGKVIMPGFIEPHLHPYLAGILLPMEFITPHDWDLPGKYSPGVQGSAAYLSRLREVEQAQEEGDWLWSWGYHQDFHGELSRTVLDELSATRPIVVWHRSFHEIYVNTRALEELGLAGTEIDHPQVKLAKGHFYENGLQVLLPELMPKLLNPFRYLKAMSQARDIIHAGGITTVGDGAFGSINLDIEYLILRFSSWARSSSPFRFQVLLDGKALGAKLGHQQAMERMLELDDKSTEKIHFPNRQVKLFADGAAYSLLMQMREDYLDGHHGEWLMTPEELEAAARVYWQADFQLHIHVNGDLGLDRTLDIIAKLQDEYPRQDHRSTIHHLAYARPDQAARMADLGMRVSANPYYVWALADKYAEVGLGPERAYNMVPLQSMNKAGVPISLHSDFTMAPAQPLLLAWAAASRETAAGNVVGEVERLSVQKALEGITIEAARQMQQEQSIGSLEQGKLADFTVLEQDPFELPLKELKDIAIWGTVLAGKIHPLQQ